MNFFRICKINGKIEIRVPFETSTWLKIDHKRGFSCFSFVDYVERRMKKKINYDDTFIPIKIDFMGYYEAGKKGNFVFYLMKKFGVRFYNLIGYRIVEQTFIKYLFPLINIKVIFKKLPS